MNECCEKPGTVISDCMSQFIEKAKNEKFSSKRPYDSDSNLIEGYEYLDEEQPDLTKVSREISQNELETLVTEAKSLLSGCDGDSIAVTMNEMYEYIQKAEAHLDSAKQKYWTLRELLTERLGTSLFA